MKDLVNKSRFMWVKQVAESTIVHEKQFNACDSSDIATQTNMVLEQANIHVNNSKHSKKTRNNTHTNENTKSGKNATQVMERGLTPKQLS